jgi:hypothetical protein
MNFGSLQIVTAWRLTKADVMCQGIVMDAPEGVRLVVIEDQRIVEWECFRRIFDLRRRLRLLLNGRRRAGWVPMAGPATDVDLRSSTASRRRRRVPPAAGLFPTEL